MFERLCRKLRRKGQTVGANNILKNYPVWKITYIITLAEALGVSVLQLCEFKNLDITRDAQIIIIFIAYFYPSFSRVDFSLPLK